MKYITTPDFKQASVIQYVCGRVFTWSSCMWLKVQHRKKKRPFEKMTNGWFDFCKMARPRSGKLTRTQCCKVSSERKVIKSHIGRLQLYSYIFYKLTVIIKLRTLIVYCLRRLTHFSVMLTVLTNLDCPQFLCSVFKFYIQVLVKFFTHVFYNNLLSIFLPLPTIYSDFYQF